VAVDLGTWQSAQATVLVQVLRRAQLNPDAKRTRAGIVVTVPDEEADRAHRAIAANMDAIADAARSTPTVRRPSRPAGSGHPSERPLATERILGAARPIALVLVAVLVLGVIGRVSPLLAIAGVGVGVYLLGRRAQSRGEDPRG
jgi:hypothetical protein